MTENIKRFKKAITLLTLIADEEDNSDLFRIVDILEDFYLAML